VATRTDFEKIETIEPQPATRGRRRFAQIADAFQRDPRLWFGIALFLCVIGAIFAPFISPYPPLQYHPSITAQGPSLAHLLGTDELGRDQLSRIIYGARISLSVGIATILLGGICGTILGIIGAYLKGWVDQVITMVVDALLSFPSLILALAIAAALGPSIINVVISLAVVRIPIYARLARGQTLQAAAQDYVTAGIVSGTGTGKMMVRHILPNIFSPLLVQATISISFAILDESVLSFLGLGAQPPTPEWGSMISEAQPFLNSDPWMMFGPALAIILIVLSLNLVGDALRDRLDPRDVTRMAAPTQK
jgi:ABC-type dipeptide/oligopeptide/nickel transport system permease subunit